MVSVIPVWLPPTHHPGCVTLPRRFRRTKRPRHLTNSQTTQRNSAQIRVTPSNTTDMSPFRPATHRFEVAHSIRICRSLFLLLWGGPTVRFSTRRHPQDRADPGNPWTHPRLRCRPAGDLKSPTAGRRAESARSRSARRGSARRVHCGTVSRPTGRGSGTGAGPGRRTNQCRRGFGEWGACGRVLPCGGRSVNRETGGERRDSVSRGA